MAFTDTWTALQTQLKVGATIPNWTAHSGPIGEPFEIVAVDQNRIVVDPPSAAKHQSVRQKDFEVVYDRWVDYVGKAFGRSAFSSLTGRSKYAISILHWLQERSGDHLP